MRVHVERSRDSYLQTQLVGDAGPEPVAFRRTRAPSGSRAGAVPAPDPTLLPEHRRTP
jgi:hypothetical protein